MGAKEALAYRRSKTVGSSGKQNQQTLLGQ